ncbi:MAG: SH3 domain-containing protein [Lachnospiraceae bacterium]|nr:SH3 domain-containing protein [Lachnospiraceae bacterium]
MKKLNRLYDRMQMLAGALVLVVALVAGLSMDAFTIISHAESTGKITASTVKIRQEASTSSNTLASVSKGDTVVVKGQTQASDGYTWYQVVINGDQTGYIRGDLMEITDGSTPGTIVASTTGQTTTTTPTGTNNDESVVEVVDVQPVSASVSGTSPVRVRQNASTTSRIVSTAQGGLAMTVTGKASGTDGNEWYRVTFIANGSEVTGFIRADYVTVDGELVAGGETAPAEASEQPTEQPIENTDTGVDGSKDWDTFYQDNIWHLVDNTSGKSYSIPQIFETVETNNNTLKEVLATNKTQQIAVVALVIVVVLLICAMSVLFFKLKEVKEDAYYEKVERETMRKRAADRTGQTGNGTKVETNTGNRPTGQRSAEGGNNGQRQAGGARNNGKRPEGVNQEGQRADGRRPESQRNEGQKASSQRPTGSGKKHRPASGANNGQRRPAEDRRPVEERTQEKRQSAEDKRTAERRAAEQERTKAVQAEKVPEKADILDIGADVEEVREDVQESVDRITENIEEAAKEVSREIEAEAVARGAAKPKWKSKNFADDDEFEFQFLDWDEDQE